MNRISILLARRWRNQRAERRNQGKQQQQATANRSLGADNQQQQQQQKSSGNTNVAPQQQAHFASCVVNAQQASADARRRSSIALPMQTLRQVCESPSAAVSATDAIQFDRQQQQPMQTAFDFAQQAAAKVTGSAAAAIAAASRFKMLRSDTLAAAFSTSPRNADTQQQPPHSPGPPSPGNYQTIDLIAMRTKDEKVVNRVA